ncbi:MAG: glycosyltransferase family 4 protein [archaeon]
MKIYIYTECPSKFYFNAIYQIPKIQVELIDSKILYNLMIKLNNRSKLLRYIRYKLTGKKAVYKNEPTFKQIIKSLIIPIEMLFTNKPIILFFAPYGKDIYYMYLLKLLGKNITYMTSWPNWSGLRYAKPSSKFRRVIWHQFINGTKCVAITKRAAEHVAKRKGIVYHIPHSIDTKFFHPIRHKKNQTFNILSVGRTVKAKGIIDILKISKFYSNIEFRFAGEGELDNLIKSKEQELPVKHYGLVKDKMKLLDLYTTADIFILNSYSVFNWEELFGIVLLEAMASGVPVITTDCIGPKEIIQDGKNGYLIPQRNKKELKRRIDKLLKNKRLRDKFAKNGRKTVVEKYDSKKVAKLWMQALK